MDGRGERRNEVRGERQWRDITERDMIEKGEGKEKKEKIGAHMKRVCGYIYIYIYIYIPSLVMRHKLVSSREGCDGLCDVARPDLFC